MNNSENHNSVMYLGGVGDLGVPVAFQDDTVWMTQKSMATLFGVNVPAISKHLSNIFDEGELNKESVISKMEITASDGKNYDPIHYSLDAIISVGYRVNSQKATQFRIWATGIIKQYVRDGYVINEALLRQDPAKLNKPRKCMAEEPNDDGWNGVTGVTGVCGSKV